MGGAGSPYRALLGMGLDRAGLVASRPRHGSAVCACALHTGGGHSVVASRGCGVAGAVAPVDAYRWPARRDAGRAQLRVAGAHGVLLRPVELFGSGALRGDRCPCRGGCLAFPGQGLPPGWLLKFGRGMGSISLAWWAGSVPARGSSAGGPDAPARRVVALPRTTGRGLGRTRARPENTGVSRGPSGRWVARSAAGGAARPGAPGPAVLAPVPARRALRVAWVDVRRGVRSPPPDAVGGAGDRCCAGGGGASWGQARRSGPGAGAP